MKTENLIYTNLAQQFSRSSHAHTGVDSFRYGGYNQIYTPRSRTFPHLQVSEDYKSFDKHQKVLTQPIHSFSPNQTFSGQVLTPVKKSFNVNVYHKPSQTDSKVCKKKFAINDDLVLDSNLPFVKLHLSAKTLGGDPNGGGGHFQNQSKKKNY
eukprot:TRINITY_DN20813_c0_g1_i1.p2 TRINITY_DN20813_c0_g1~~TRINITY_DN20813_c0_g1_i1.p2  ORF type:complete len:153 (+),score=1.27 TRINITY_DN20813_c0_g1_i1:562-1020(+)